MAKASPAHKPFVIQEFLDELEALGEATVKIKHAQEHWTEGTQLFNLVEQFLVAKATQREQAAYRDQMTMQQKSATAAEQSAKSAELAIKTAEEALRIVKLVDLRAKIHLVIASIALVVAVCALWR